MSGYCESRSELTAGAASVLPELSFEALRERAGTLAERRLIIAVLEDAIMCFQKYMLAKSPHERRIFDQAESWLMRCDPHAPLDDRFSFAFICDALGLDRSSLRRQLERWREEQQSRVGPFVSSRQRCRWRAVYREPYRTSTGSREQQPSEAVGF